MGCGNPKAVKLTNKATPTQLQQAPIIDQKHNPEYQSIGKKETFISEGSGDIHKVYTLGKTLGKGSIFIRFIWPSSTSRSCQYWNPESG